MQEGYIKTLLTGIRQWVNSKLVPVGSITIWSGSTSPDSNWLLCDGSAVSRTTYAKLFSVISTTYGAGDDSTTFNLPDLQGKFALGASQSHALASTGGSETHTLDVTEMPSHSHEITDLNHEAGTTQSTYRTFSLNSMETQPTTVETLNPAQHTQAAGGDNGTTQPHNNMPPYITVNYIIKAL